MQNALLWIMVEKIFMFVEKQKCFHIHVWSIPYNLFLAYLWEEQARERALKLHQRLNAKNFYMFFISFCGKQLFSS